VHERGEQSGRSWFHQGLTERCCRQYTWITPAVNTDPPGIGFQNFGVINQPAFAVCSCFGPRIRDYVRFRCLTLGLHP
jgi:hypothetical protein